MTQARLHPDMSFDSQPRSERVTLEGSLRSDEARPRHQDGKFSEKHGTTPEVALDADIPGPQNDFLLPGRDCECDVDYRCPNHDTEAEAAYYANMPGIDGPGVVRTRDAHGFDDRWDY